MISNDNFKAIAELDLDPIKVKLMHKESGEGWSLEHVNAVEFEYRRFLMLMKKYPEEQTAPLFDVDIFWHYHILDTMKYAADCEHVFGYFLHHFPYIGLRGEADEEAHQRVGLRMKELYEATFGEDYIRPTLGTAGAEAGQTAWSGAATQTAWSGAAAQTAEAAVGAKTAWSGAATQTAWSGAATQTAEAAVGAKTAWSGAATQTAWSGAATQQPAEAAVGAKTAWSGAATQTAWSGAAAQKPAEAGAGAKTAWSGAATQTAWSGAAAQKDAAAPAHTAERQSSFYAQRPVLAAAR